MFIKMYRYKIKKKDFQKWEKIVNGANKVYREYGGKKWMKFTRKEKDIIAIMEMGFYPAKVYYKKMIKKVDKDPRIKRLFSEFLKLVNRSDIEEEEFELL